jgi:hypothetical protein
MKIFNIEIRRYPTPPEELKELHLNKLEYNAITGLVQAKLDLKIHTLLLEQSKEVKRTKEEIKGYTDAIERDKKTINNFETQLIAIQYERN